MLITLLTRLYLIELNSKLKVFYLLSNKKPPNQRRFSFMGYKSFLLHLGESLLFPSVIVLLFRGVHETDPMEN